MSWEIGADARLPVSRVSHNGFDSADDGSDGAVYAAGRFLVDASVLDAVLLVPDAEGRGGAVAEQVFDRVCVAEECGLVPKFDVGDDELVGDAMFRRFEVGVFADSEEVVERDDGHVADGAGSWGAGMLSGDVEEAGDFEGDGELWLRRRVVSFVAFQLLLDGLRIACLRRSQGAAFSVQ